MVSIANQNDLTRAIVEALEEYNEEIDEILQEEIEEVTEESVEELKRNSPKRKNNGGKYAKGWAKKAINSNGQKGFVIYNRVYRLTHLLEKGHAKRNGGRVDAIPHIAPVEEELESKLGDKIARRIKTVG